MWRWHTEERFMACHFRGHEAHFSKILGLFRLMLLALFSWMGLVGRCCIGNEADERREKVGKIYINDKDGKYGEVN